MISNTTETAQSLRLEASPDSCFWGYFDSGIAPALTVEAGTVIEIEAVTHHSGDAPDLLMDDGIRAIWDGIAPEARTPGVHVMTGPIEIAGAEPGDALVVEILDMWPRLAFGSNCAAHWGRLYDNFAKERITIYELDDPPLRLEGVGYAGFPATAHPLFGFDFTERELYDLPGVVSTPDPEVREAFSRTVSVPVRPHLGVMGVAPPGIERVSSVPPGVFGGNVDNWRFGPGAVIRYPVFHPGAMFFVGDPHFGQGDGELCGTAIEASLDVRLRLSIEPGLAPEAPLLEHGGLVYTHGFGANLDDAMLHAARQTVDLLTDRFGLTRDEAYSIASVAVDIGITQVVDGTLGCHAAIDPSMFG